VRPKKTRGKQFFPVRFLFAVRQRTAKFFAVCPIENARQSSIFP
jgi:hypothetical protein